MNRVIITLVVCSVLLISISSNLLAQEKKAKSQLFTIHDDHVKPSMVAEYEKAVKGFKDMLTEYGISDMSYGLAVTDDYHYLFVSPIEKMADLDENPLADMAKEVGEEKMDMMWKKFDNCFESHTNYISRLSHELSYNPKKTSMLEGEELFRHWNYYYILPEKEEEIKAIAKEWKELYSRKNIDHGYRMYIGGIGTETPLYVSVQWAKDHADFSAKRAKVNKLLGEEGKALYKKTIAITRRFEQKEGWMRPELSYMPETETASME